MTRLCGQYCSHGGVCDLDEGHDGLHSAGGYCQWTTEESLDAETANDRFRLGAAARGSMTAECAELVIALTTRDDGKAKP